MPCWQDRVVAAIRSMYGLNGGFIENGGAAMFPNNIITTDGDYHFVNFQKKQGM